jgi:hypothetical protein
LGTDWSGEQISEAVQVVWEAFGIRGGRRESRRGSDVERFHLDWARREEALTTIIRSE